MTARARGLKETHNHMGWAGEREAGGFSHPVIAGQLLRFTEGKQVVESPRPARTHDHVAGEVLIMRQQLSPRR